MNKEPSPCSSRAYIIGGRGGSQASLSSAISKCRIPTSEEHKELSNRTVGLGDQVRLARAELITVLQTGLYTALQPVASFVFPQ